MVSFYIEQSWYSKGDKQIPEKFNVATFKWWYYSTVDVWQPIFDINISKINVTKIKFKKFSYKITIMILSVS